MIVTERSKSFEPHPAGQFRAVCVDCTPPKTVDTRFGRQEIFRYVFETEARREDGAPWCVWDRGMTPSLHEKSNLRKRLKQWLGRDLTADERAGLFVESSG